MERKQRSSAIPPIWRLHVDNLLSYGHRPRSTRNQADVCHMSDLAYAMKETLLNLRAMALGLRRYAPVARELDAAPIAMGRQRRKGAETWSA